MEDHYFIGLIYSCSAEILQFFAESGLGPYFDAGSLEILLLVVFSACGGMRTGSKITAYFPVLA